MIYDINWIELNRIEEHLSAESNRNHWLRSNCNWWIIWPDGQKDDGSFELKWVTENILFQRRRKKLVNLVCQLTIWRFPFTFPKKMRSLFYRHDYLADKRFSEFDILFKNSIIIEFNEFFVFLVWLRWFVSRSNIIYLWAKSERRKRSHLCNGDHMQFIDFRQRTRRYVDVHQYLFQIRIVYLFFSSHFQTFSQI